MSQKHKQILWKISLGMISLYGGIDDVKILEDQLDIWNQIETDSFDIPDSMFYGVQEAKSKFVRDHLENKVKTYLKNTFDIIDTSTLLHMIKELSSFEDVVLEMDNHRKKIIFMNFKDKLKLLETMEPDSHSYRVCSMLIKHDHILPKDGIVAFNISNYTNLCRLGAYIGYITKEQALEYIDKIALTAQSSYSSFKEYGIASTIGLICYSGYKGFYDYYLYTLNQVLNHPKSYWKRLDWEMKLD